MGKPPKVRKTRPLEGVVQHILAAIEQIERFIAGLDENSYLADDKTQRAVERCLEIVSEASRDVPPPIKSEHPEIDWRRMADAGNVYRHVYHLVNSVVVWRTVQIDLPPLKAAIESIRERHCKP